MYLDENRKKLYKATLDKMKMKSKLSGEDWWVFRGLHNEPFKIFWSSEKKKFNKREKRYYERQKRCRPG